jgi:hypothetical protein
MQIVFIPFQASSMTEVSSIQEILVVSSRDLSVSLSANSLSTDADSVLVNSEKRLADYGFRGKKYTTQPHTEVETLMKLLAVRACVYASVMLQSVIITRFNGPRD